MKTIINAQQGSEAWLQARRDCDTASEAPAAFGKSKYQSRQELLHQKRTGLTADVDIGTQKLFDRGHAAEASARVIAEEILGEELFPITAMVELDGLRLLASLDGLTMGEEIAFEHKLWSENLAEQVRTQSLEPHYTIQMDQQCLVTGAKKVMFMTSDGTKNNLVWCWYEPSKKNLDGIIVNWLQFHTDLAAYVPPEIKEKPKAESIEEFPVPSIIVHGEVTASNLSQITPVFDEYLAKTKTQLVTDQDFADGEANGKNCREAAKNLKLTAKAVIDQIAPVSEAVRTLELYATKFDAMGLLLEKAVKEQKESIKTNAIMKAKGEWSEHVASLESEITPIRLNLIAPDFAKAVSGVKTMKSLHGNIADALAAGKIAADSAARDIRAKLAWHREYAKDHQFLFADLQQIINKPEDDFQLLVNTRIADHKRIEDEKAAKAQADAAIEAAKAVEPAPVIAPSVVNQQSITSQPVDTRAAVIEHQDEIAAFMDSRAFGKEENKIRAVLVEFVKFQSTFGMKKAA